ncbi:hypothetical protein FNT36_20755 [Hymenobacter setariae]|uniref:Uncharacterized protein n=1 Tax=Hymenobacter setariae TaxID=2594794 RepID=A0A558BQ45_9BACT|nr:hypothetical protein [Hymenobacter setariae]TVT38612.1 hypothetical protein FNT36_20755 [Hymenobacter setariae]
MPNVNSSDDNAYSFEEAVAIINTFHSRVYGQLIKTDKTPQRNTIKGKADGFLALPYEPGSYSFELALFNYNLTPFKEEWIAAKRREGHRWLPLVRIAGQYVALVPVLLDMLIWDESWRNAV